MLIVAVYVNRYYLRLALIEFMHLANCITAKRNFGFYAGEKHRSCARIT